MDESAAIISLKEIYFTYPRGKQVLEGLDFNFPQNGRAGLVGPTGSGKTTLVHIIMGLLKPDSGRVEIFGSRREKESDFRDVRARIGFLFQDADDQLFCPTVAEDVAFGPLNLGVPKSEVRKLVKDTLGQLELDGFENRVTYKLSGGEKRLVSLATVLAMKPEMLLMDEPTTGLDDKTMERLVHLLLKSNLPYLIISHDNEFLKQTTNRIYRMNKGTILDQVRG
ncbi:MAG: ABC transporter ATP-binding protein [Deltaproteobacteria bacterium]|nr:ABC transporter ATP-binding protein [Deltaproteobacteria bacterium]MBW2051448.1 ABC transporter ATP-binding protein [Deltaproteobacteria bacterium]MBW2140676.1 ABC transporter ATP-binding protein [Deltaproteobacteria bacterium]MBW2322637.1 ABC transporter ATP-binding protein [Deltaproteobacteria bacterium]